MGSVGFFIDEPLPWQMAAALQALGYEAISAADAAPPGTDDQEHFRYCRDRRLVFVTRDWEINRNKTEKEALAEARITVVEIRNPRATSEELIEIFFGQLTRMVRLLADREPEVYVARTKTRMETLARDRARVQRRRRS